MPEYYPSFTIQLDIIFAPHHHNTLAVDIFSTIPFNSFRGMVKIQAGGESPRLPAMNTGSESVSFSKICFHSCKRIIGTEPV